MSQTSTYGAGASGKEAKAGRADFSNLTIMKVLDATSPLLCDHCATGNILQEGLILYDKPVGDKQEDYFRIYLKDALITSVQLSGSNENPTESVSFRLPVRGDCLQGGEGRRSLWRPPFRRATISNLTADYAAPETF